MANLLNTRQIFPQALKMDSSGQVGGIFSQGLGLRCIHGVAKDLYQCVGRIVVPGMLICTSVGKNPTSWSLGSGVVQIPPNTSISEEAIFMLIQKVSDKN